MSVPKTRSNEHGRNKNVKTINKNVKNNKKKDHDGTIKGPRDKNKKLLFWGDIVEVQNGDSRGTHARIVNFASGSGGNMYLILSPTGQSEFEEKPNNFTLKGKYVSFVYRTETDDVESLNAKISDFRFSKQSLNAKISDFRVGKH